MLQLSNYSINEFGNILEYVQEILKTETFLRTYPSEYNRNKCKYLEIFFIKVTNRVKQGAIQ